MSTEKFEKSLEKLEGLVKKLESGELDLDQSLKAFEEGVRLSRVCEKKLNEAEKRIEVLLKNNNNFDTKPFSDESSNPLSQEDN